MTVKDIVKQIYESGNLVKGGEEANAVHQAFIDVYGSEFKPVTKESVIRYGRQIENKLYAHKNNGGINRIIPHVRGVIRKLK
jgi:hypothetical protein